MIRLLTFCLLSAAIRAQVAGNYQPGVSGGEAHPIYNLVASSLLSRYPGLNTTAGDPGPPLTCTCGFCNQRALALPPSAPPRSSVLSGVVVFPSSELQQVLRAPVPTPLYAPSPHSLPQPPSSYTPPNPQPNTPSSYIMSIPRKYSQEAPPPKPLQDTSYPSQISYPSPSTPPSPPRPYYYTPQSPLMASCPATFYFPPTEAMSFNHPYSHPSPPPPPPPQTNSPPFYSPPFYSNAHPPYLRKPSLPPTSPTLPTGSKEPMVTYTLRGTNDVSPGTSLEAESKDCAMPTPPVLV